MTLIYTALMVWMMLSFIAALIMNPLFTIGWLKENGEEPDYSYGLGPLSNFLKALDVASERKVMPKELRMQRIFYVQTALCFAILLVLTTLDYFKMIR